VFLGLLERGKRVPKLGKPGEDALESSAALGWLLLRKLPNLGSRVVATTDGRLNECNDSGRESPHELSRECCLPPASV